MDQVALIQIIWAALAASSSVIGAGVLFAIKRLIAAIDQLSKKAGAHDVRLAKLETRIGP